MVEVGTDVLIAKKSLLAHSPGEFHELIKSFYKERVVAGKETAPAPGIAFSRTKKGSLSLRFTKAKRPFPYVLKEEIEKILLHYGMERGELLAALEKRDFLIVEKRIEAERIFAKQ